MSSQIPALVGWTVLPNIATNFLQNVYYGITIRAGEPKPQPGSPRYVKHYKRIRIVVILTYLLFTILQADDAIRRASDYYQDLGVSYNIDDRGIKSRFRRLAAIYHPDKVTSNSPSSQDFFVHLKVAQDTLLDPAKRFAYERFGPEIIEWKGCSSTYDYVSHGVMGRILGHYGAMAIFMYIGGMLGYLEWGKHWRWVTLISLFAFECHTISRPFYPAFASKILNPLLVNFTNHPPYLPFQLISLARTMSVTIYIAFSQIGPLLQSPEVARATQNSETLLLQQLEGLHKVALMADKEASRLTEMEMAPFQHDPAALNDLKGKVKEWLVTNTVRSDPEVSGSIHSQIQKRRADAPAGARGNR